MRRTRTCLAVGIAALLAASALPAAAGPAFTGVADLGPEPAHRAAYVFGRVFDTQREPVGGATVELVDRSSGRVVREATTSRDGEFRMRPVRPGHYVVRAHKRGVGSDRLALRAEPGRNPVRLVLEGR